MNMALFLGTAGVKPETGTLPGTSGATTTQTKDPRAGRHLAVQLLLLNLDRNWGGSCDLPRQRGPCLSQRAAALADGSRGQGASLRAGL
ncbi:unnamed protein product [Gadus morhua 'NCC']